MGTDEAGGANDGTQGDGHGGGTSETEEGFVLEARWDATGEWVSATARSSEQTGNRC